MTTNTPSDAALIETVRRTVGATAAFPMKDDEHWSDEWVREKLTALCDRLAATERENKRLTGELAGVIFGLEWGLACNVGRPTAPSAKASEDVSPSQRHPADGDEEGSTRP